MGYQPVPITPLVLYRYVAFLARSLKYNSIGKYLNIIRIMHLEVGLPNPLEDNWPLKCLLAGVKRSKGVEVVRKLAITPDLLLRIRGLLDWENQLDVVFWAACLVAFFGLLRKSNLFPPTNTGLIHQNIWIDMILPGWIGV